MEDIESANSQYKRAVVAQSLLCQRCGYNLRGVRIDRDCPECGFAVITSVEDAIDPEASRLPDLRDPAAVGRSLTCLTLSILITAILLIVPTFLEAMREAALSMTIRADPRVVGTLFAMAAIAAGITIFCSRRLRPPRDAADEHHVRLHIRMTYYGLLMIIIIATMQSLLAFDIIQPVGGGDPSQLERRFLRIGIIVGSIVTLLGTGNLVREIGQRSRTYRQSEVGVQRIQAMNVALVFMIIGTLLPLLPTLRRVGWVGTSSAFVVAACALMVLIGLGYLVMNARWIRNAILAPPRRFRELVQLEADTTFDSLSDEPGTTLSSNGVDHAIRKDS